MRPQAEGWEIAYAGANPTDWELISLSDLKDCLVSLNLDLRSVRKALDIGCGRALRDFVALLALPQLNRRSFDFTAIDLSVNATRTANSIARALSGLYDEGTFPFRSELERELRSRVLPRLKASLQIKRADLFEFLDATTEQYDLVLDWMCFHEMHPDSLGRYAELVARVCNRYFVLKLFSLEGSSVSNLGYVLPGIRKYAFSYQDVRAIFGREFHIELLRSYPEDLNPILRPTDGFVAAKRAYLLTRRP